LVSEEDVRLVNNIAWPLGLSDLARRSTFDVLRRYGYPLPGRSFNAAPRLRLQILAPQPVKDRCAQLTFVCLLDAQCCPCEPFVLEVEVTRECLFNNMLTDIERRCRQRASRRER
jgi:hypothetical protein